MCQDLFHALVSVTTLLGYSPLSDCMPRDVPGFISCTSECNNSDWDIHLSQTACLEMCRDLFHALVSVTTLLRYSSLSDCMPRDVPGFISCTSECNNITEIFISLRLHA